MISAPNTEAVGVGPLVEGGWLYVQCCLMWGID